MEIVIENLNSLGFYWLIFHQINKKVCLGINFFFDFIRGKNDVHVATKPRLLLDMKLWSKSVHWCSFMDLCLNYFYQYHELLLVASAFLADF